MVDPALERDVDPQQQIRHVARMIRRAWLVILTCVGAGVMVGVALWFFLPRNYMSTYKISMRSGWMFDSPGMQRTLTDLPWPARARLLEDQLRATTFLRDVLDKVEWSEWARAKGRGETQLFLLKVKANVNVRLTPAETGERFLLITFTWHEPRAAADFCKALVETWFESSIASYAADVNRMVSLGEETARAKQDRLDEAERALEQFETRNGVSAISNQNQNVQQRADDFRSNLDNLSADIANRDRMVEAMDQSLSATDEEGKPLYPPTLAGTGSVNNPEKQAHIDAILALLQEIEEYKIRGFTEKYRPYAAALDKLKILVASTSKLDNSVELPSDALPNPEYVGRKAARDQVFVELQGMYAQRSRMESDLAAVEKKLETLPEILRQHASLQSTVSTMRQLAFDQQMANQPLKDKQLALKGDQPYQKLEEPVPAMSPTTAVGWLALVVSTILGLGVAIAFVVGKELLRSSFTSADQARRTLRLPVLGEVAQIQTVPEVRRARMVRLVQIAASFILLAGLGSVIWVCVAHPEDLPRGLVEWAQGLREALS